jgi:hypothetical protein
VVSLFRNVIQTLWQCAFREALTRAKFQSKPAIEVLFKRFDAALAAAGFLAMGGQIVDATIVAAPKQRKAGRHMGKMKRECICRSCGASFLPAPVPASTH